MKVVLAWVLAAAVTLPSCASEPDAVELIVTAVPPRINVGGYSTIEVRMVAVRTVSGVVLSIVQPGVEAVTPASYAIDSLAAPRTPMQPVGQSPPNPPALGVVPIRSFRVAARQPGDMTVLIRLTYGDRTIMRSIVVGVDP